jgi:phosphatidylinositol-3-phosphatase
MFNRKRIRRYTYLYTRCVFAFALLIILASCGSSTTGQQKQSTPAPTLTPTAAQGISVTVPTIPVTPAVSATASPQSTPLQHIFYIMMENHATNQIIGNTADAPYLNQLANSYGVASHYYGVTHPSLPNYLAAISGNFQGIWDDCPAGNTITCAPAAFGSMLTSAEYTNASQQTHLFSGQTIVDQLEAHHMTWKAYMQSMPSVGYTGGSYGLYGQKHDPFMYFATIRNNAARMQQIVPFTQFAQDIRSQTVPNFVWISPDVCNDMHGAPGCSSYDGLIAQGDAFVRGTVASIMASPAWQQGAAIVITWDENDAGRSGCCYGPTGANGVSLGGADVPLIVITSHGPHHIVLTSGSFNHYSLLATIEHLWNLGCLANTCNISNAGLLTSLFG